MGQSLAWIAVRGEHASLTLQSLGWSRSGRTAEFIDDGPSCLDLPGGWTMLCEPNAALVQPSRIRLLPAHVGVLRLFIEEHVMFSRAEFLRGGEPQWSVTHESDIDPDHLEVVGTPPVDMGAVRAAHPPEPDCDMLFEAPIAVAAAITGFRHDLAYEGSPFTVLIPAAGSPRG